MVAAVAVVAWSQLGTPQLGGSTSYIVTTGNSMEPGFHRGDLAVVRAATRYSVGDIVLYNSPSLKRPVLHRIIVIQGGGYYFKGDHNDFVDPGPVPASSLVGRLWIHVPKIGIGMRWVSNPTHAAVIASMLTVLALFGGKAHDAHDTVKRHRIRRRRRSSQAPQVAEGGTMFTAVRHRFGWADHPLALVVCAVVVLVGVVHLGVGFLQPASKDVPLADAYRHTGKFDTVAKLTQPNPAFPTGFIPIGQPLIFSMIDSATLVFDYHFLSTLPHSVHGTVGLAATITSDSSYRQDMTLEDQVAFTGDRAQIKSVQDIRKWQAFFKRLSTDSGLVNSDYHISFRPIVHVVGTVGGQAVDDTFSPSLPVTFTSTMIKMNIQAPTSLPGATYAPPTDGLAAALNPVREGSVSHHVTNQLTFLRYSLPTMIVRGIGILASLLGAALLLVIVLHRRSRPDVDAEALLRAEYAHLIVPAAVMRVDPTTACVDVQDFASLVRLALGYQCMILRFEGPSATTFSFDSDRTIYRFVEARQDATLPAPDAAPVAEPMPPALSRPDGPRRLPRTRIAVMGRLWHIGTGLLVILSVTGLAAIGLTAGNIVPSSFIGAQTIGVTISQLAPPQCAGMTFDRQILATGNSTSGSSQRDLILGKSGTGSRSYNGGSGTDCIVAGGGPGTTNSINGGGGGGDVCIGAPGAVNTFTKCATTYN